jgi:hypothetical protein
MGLCVKKKAAQKDSSSQLANFQAFLLEHLRVQNK